jgi:hypothetical protein
MAWPTTNDPRTEFVTVRFTVDEAADIDWLTSHTNAKNRSAAVRGAVDRVVAAERRRAKKTASRAGADERTLAEEPEE